MHMVNNRNFALLHETLLFAETYFALTLPPYVDVVHNRNYIPLNLLSNVKFASYKNIF